MHTNLSPASSSIFCFPTVSAVIVAVNHSRGPEERLSLRDVFMRESFTRRCFLFTASLANYYRPIFRLELRGYHFSSCFSSDAHCSLFLSCTEFQLLHTPAAFHKERIAWRFVIYLNLVRSIRRCVGRRSASFRRPDGLHSDRRLHVIFFFQQRHGGDRAGRQCRPRRGRLRGQHRDSVDHHRRAM